MTQWQVKYSDESSFNAAASGITGLWAPASTDPQTGATIPAHLITGGLGPNNGGFAVSPPMLKMVPTGKTVTDAFGNQVPEKVSDGYIYRALQWNDAMGAMPLPPGVQIVTDATTGISTISVTPPGGTLVELTSPMPADCPVSF